MLIDALCFAFETSERGYFITDGKPWSEKEIAAAVGGNVDVTFKLVLELVNKHVLKKRSDGAIYSAFMVREEEIRRKRAAGGVLGGNPNLMVNHNGNLRTNLRNNLVSDICTSGSDSPPERGGVGETDEQQTQCVSKARIVLAYLGMRAGAKFMESADCLNPIAERLFETQLDVEGIKKMVDRCVTMFKGDKVMDKCLTPGHLFGPKFHGYYGQRNMPLPDGQPKAFKLPAPGTGSL